MTYLERVASDSGRSGHYLLLLSTWEFQNYFGPVDASDPAGFYLLVEDGFVNVESVPTNEIECPPSPGLVPPTPTYLLPAPPHTHTNTH